ncbi:MAG: pseudouridine synthase [Candidatus Lokiarchaeota archaeon]|nr:pseudouridine synthase [Candidatus Lokiarchaeota archaeon]
MPVEAVSPVDARVLEAIAALQFGKHFAAFLHDNRPRIGVERSKNTGKIRFVYLDGELVLVLRPEEGFFSLSVAGARVLNGLEGDAMVNGIVVLDEVAEFVKDGKNVFAKHVVDPLASIRPSQELYVCDGKREVLAVGKAVVSGRDMRHLKRGVAVATRHGARKAGKGEG